MEENQLSQNVEINESAPLKNDNVDSASEQQSGRVQLFAPYFKLD